MYNVSMEKVSLKKVVKNPKKHREKENANTALLLVIKLVKNNFLL